MEVWKLEDVQDILTDSDEMGQEIKKLTEFVESTDGWDTLSRRVLALMKGAAWRNDSLFQTVSQCKNQVEALCGLFGVVQTV